MKKTLLDIGDSIRIRGDISPQSYYMKTNDVKMEYIENEMAPANTWVKIKNVIYDKNRKAFGYILEDPYGFYTYTDNMFDQDTINYLYSIKDK